MDERLENISNAVSCIKSRIGGFVPLVGIVLGSGLGKLAEEISDKTVIPFKEIPGFPVSTATGHKGNLIFGTLGGRPVVAMQGRFHYYEGYAMSQVTIGVRTMKMLGVKYYFASNAAGACNQDFKVGDLVLIKDHINLMPNPLIGKNMEDFGPRFPDMTCAYDLELQKLALSKAGALGIALRSGVYLANTGPTYETPAEVRFYRAAGADLVGMSTVPEVICARHCGLRVMGMSVVTNVSNIRNEERNLNDGEDVVRQADAAADRMSLLFKSIISELD